MSESNPHRLSQLVAEVLVKPTDRHRLSQFVVEVLVSEEAAPPRRYNPFRSPRFNSPAFGGGAIR